MKPSIPKGTRDFLPGQAAKRNYLFQTLREVFELHGFLPVETPAMEKLETLTGKYGEEGDRLIFKILSRGAKLERALENRPVGAKGLAEEALRYDLTVPFARMVVQYQHEINFPFKRYQIQPVWRADRPQKGRYREFFQCDVDVIGSNSLLNELELIEIMAGGFNKLGLPDVTVKINNRKVLLGLAQHLGVEDKFNVITVALDKLDKVGVEGVLTELSENGFTKDQLDRVEKILNTSQDNNQKINYLREVIGRFDKGKEGVEEVAYLLKQAERFENITVEFDFSLARGLDYYTGTIFEVVHPDFPSSICGGGRYDDLTGVFGMKDVSGVGISFGADRIYDLMESKGLFPGNLGQSAQLLFVNFGEREAETCTKYATEVRANGVSCELYPDAAKLKKQFKYADDKRIPFVAVVGEAELESGLINLKNMATGDQEACGIDELIVKLKENPG